MRKYLYVRSITTLFCADTSPQFFHPILSEEWLVRLIDIRAVSISLMFEVFDFLHCCHSLD